MYFPTAPWEAHVVTTAMNPVAAFLECKTAADAARKERELGLWRTWKESGRAPEHLDPLLRAFAPLLQQKVQQWKAPAVSPGAFKAELQGQFIHALDTYDPTRGAALGTHVEIHLQKAKRYNNRYQNLAYIPEGQAAYIGRIDKAHDELSEDLGRAPTHDEVAERVGLTPARVARIQKARMRDIPASAFESDPTERAALYEEQQLAVAAHILPDLFPGRPDMQKLFNFTFGTNDHPKVTSTTELARRMGRNPSQISRMKTQMGTALRSRMGLGGGAT
jgi:DNA-directed RNA polymerase specialized sigma subunit